MIQAIIVIARWTRTAGTCSMREWCTRHPEDTLRWLFWRSCQILGLSRRSGWYLTPLLTYFFLCVLCCGDHTSKWEGWFHTIPSAEKRNPEKTKPTFLFCFPFFPSISLVLLVTTKTNKGVTPWTMLCLSVTMRTCQAMRWGDEHSEGKLMKKIIKE